MKTQSTKLQFDKNSITELNSSESIAVKGGCQWSHSSGPILTIKISIVADNPSQNDNVSF